MVGVIIVFMLTLTQNKWRVDGVLGAWPLYGLCGTWSGITAGILDSKTFGGSSDVTLGGQLIGTVIGVVRALTCGLLVYGLLKMTMGLRLSQKEEYDGADLSIHKITATSQREVT
ncbi:MAG: Amt family ammonium transporter [Rhodoferax sp.]